jgi:hypothetical protein
MSSTAADTKPATVLVTFTVTKTLPANPKMSDLDAVKIAAASVKETLSKIGGAEVTGQLTIGKQKFEL